MNKYWKGKLWSPSYYVGIEGHVFAETIQKYIEEQRQREHNNNSIMTI